MPGAVPGRGLYQPTTTSLYLSERQKAALRLICDALNVSQSRVIRAALDAALADPSKIAQAVQR
jgi:hypothetical protein